VYRRSGFRDVRTLTAPDNLEMMPLAAESLRKVSEVIDVSLWLVASRRATRARFPS
jgi:hypothetical protein